MNSHLYFRFMNSQIEFIELNLIIFCDRQTDKHTHTQTLWLIESLDLPDRETKNSVNNQNTKDTMVKEIGSNSEIKISYITSHQGRT